MRRELLGYLACPQCWGAFELAPLAAQGAETEAGFLTCRDCRRLYPVIDGVPRLVPDAIIDHYPFCEQHRRDIPPEIWNHNFTPENLAAARRAIRRQKRTQASFSIEWGLQGGGQRTWGYAPEERLQHILRRSLELSPGDCQGKTLLDAGCGNGILTALLGEHFAAAIGVDLGSSVLEAHRRNTRPNVHFVQGDLMHPPLRRTCIDVLISLGVLHHTPNTELAFSCLTPLIAQGGRVYLWLYKPESDLHHQVMLALREGFKHLPPGLSATIFKLTLVPAALLKRRLLNAVRKTKIPAQSAEEQLVHFMDALTCPYRFEHTAEEAAVWFRKRGFSNIHVPVSEYLGFGIYGDRS